MKCCGSRQKVEGLQDEADLPVPNVRELVVGHCAHFAAVQHVASAGVGIQAAQQIHKGGLARARGSHDGQVVPSLDTKIDSL